MTTLLINIIICILHNTYRSIQFIKHPRGATQEEVNPPESPENRTNMVQGDLIDGDFLVFIIITSVSILCGTVGNALVIAVFVSNKQHFPKRTYILTLAVVDLVVMVLVAPYSIVFELRLVTNDFLCHALEIIRHTLIGYSNLVLMFIASERFLLVWKPLKIVTNRTKRVCIIGFFIFSIACASPSAAVYKVSTHCDSSNNSSLVLQEYCSYTTSILGVTGSDVYMKIIAISVFFEVLFLIVSYILIYVGIYRQRKKLTGVFVGSIRTPNVPNKPKTIENEQNKRELSNKNSTTQTCHPQEDSNGNEQFSKNIVDAKLEGTFSNIDQSKYCGTSKTIERPFITDTHEQESESTTCPCTSRHDEIERLQDDPIEPDNGRTLPKSGKPRDKRGSTTSRGSSAAQKRSHVDTKTWTMLSICTFLYIVCWIPFSINILNVYRSLVLKYFFFIGQASNPIIYSIVNVKVRKQIKELLFGKSSRPTGFTPNRTYSSTSFSTTK